MGRDIRSAYSLGLTRRSAMLLLLDLSKKLHGLSVELNKDISVDQGFYKYRQKSAVVGAAALYGSGLKSLFRVSDMDFTRAVVALYHEYGHHLDNVDPKTSKEVVLSTISTFHNRGYRIHGWSEFPHEISAERTGVSYAYRVMEGLFGKCGANCVLDYVRDKISNTSYVLKECDVPSEFIYSDDYESCYSWTCDDLSGMFDRAMVRSLECKRATQAGLRRYETDRMSEFFKTPEGVPYFKKFIDEVPGALKDRMAASVNIHIDPELIDPRLDASDVDMDRVFNIQQRSVLMQKCFDVVATANRDSCIVDRQGPDL